MEDEKEQTDYVDTLSRLFVAFHRLDEVYLYLYFANGP